MSKARSYTGTAFGVLLGGTIAAGCSVSDKDLQRWETTQGGPRRLSSVVMFDKYPHELRVKSALALIEMRPRKGQHVGIDRLVRGTLDCDPSFAANPDEPCARKTLEPETRARILADLVPLIIAELQKPPPTSTQGDNPAPDPSFKHKDAALLLLTYERTKLIADPALRKQLEDALTAWAMADFQRRLADRSQAFGMEQLLRHIGPSSVVDLPDQIRKDTPNLAKIADLIAKIGSEETKEAAGKKLVAVVSHVASKEWRDAELPRVKEANRKAGFDPGEAALKKQMLLHQENNILNIYSAMKKVGGPSVVKYCLGVAASKKDSTKQRQGALAAIEGHISKKQPAQLEALIAIAKSEAPSVVVDQAFRRIKELPREVSATPLYSFFEVEDWKIRRLAGATLLSISKAKHVDEFLTNLTEKARKNFNLPEAITYGAYLGGLEPKADALKALKPHMERGETPARLAALSYYYDKGLKKDLAAIAPFENDGQRIASCDEEAGCDWTCLVDEAGKKEKVSKEIKTVGHYVTYCVKPAILAREAKAKEDKKTKDDKKPEKK